MQDLIDRVLSALKAEDKAGSDQASKQLDHAEQTLEEINATVKNLYQDKISGKMSESFFYNFLSDYEEERQELESKIPLLRDKVRQNTGREEKVRR